MFGPGGHHRPLLLASGANQGKFWCVNSPRGLAASSHQCDNNRQCLDAFAAEQGRARSVTALGVLRRPALLESGANQGKLLCGKPPPGSSARSSNNRQFVEAFAAEPGRPRTTALVAFHRPLLLESGANQGKFLCGNPRGSSSSRRCNNNRQFLEAFPTAEQQGRRRARALGVFPSSVLCAAADPVQSYAFFSQILHKRSAGVVGNWESASFPQILHKNSSGVVGNWDCRMVRLGSNDNVETELQGEDDGVAVDHGRSEEQWQKEENEYREAQNHHDHPREFFSDGERQLDDVFTAFQEAEIGGQRRTEKLDSAADLDTEIQHHRSSSSSNGSEQQQQQQLESRDGAFDDGGNARGSFGEGRKLEREMEMAVRAVQLACLLSQRTQQRVLHLEETADEKTDRSLVTVADWGVQAVVSWVLSQGCEGEEAIIPMIAEEDTAGLRGLEKIDLMQRVVNAVNECLQESGIVGIKPPAQPLGALDVLQAIGKGSAEGGKSGRYWVLDPVDGTLGFVRGDQYAIALALMEGGEVILAVLGCPNFPLRKQWLRYHHRYYRLASKLHPPSPGAWHKGLILTTTKGAGQVIMHPLVVNADGFPQLRSNIQAPRRVSVSSIDDPAKATFCEPFEKSNSSHSFTAGLAQSLGLRNRPLRVYSLAKYAAIARGDAEIFMKFAKAGYKEKIWDHAAGVLIVQEAGGVVTDATGRPLDFSQGRFLEGLDRGIIACSGKTLHEQLLRAVDASWNSSTL